MAKNIISYWNRKPVRVVSINEGAIYVYEPINPAATKNRGRQCELLKHDSDSFGANPEQSAEVRWLDTKRKGMIDIHNLIHIDQIHKSKKELENEAREYILKQL